MLCLQRSLTRVNCKHQVSQKSVSLPNSSVCFYTRHQYVVLSETTCTPSFSSAECENLRPRRWCEWFVAAVCPRCFVVVLVRGLVDSCPAKFCSWPTLYVFTFSLRSSNRGTSGQWAVCAATLPRRFEEWNWNGLKGAWCQCIWAKSQRSETWIVHRPVLITNSEVRYIKDENNCYKRHY